MRELLLLGALIALPDRLDLSPPRLLPPSPQTMLLGDWKLERLELIGQRGNNSAGRDCVFRIDANETTFIMNGQPSPGDGLTAKHKLDFSTNPIQIDLMPKQRNDTMRGLIRLEGDRMTMALSTGQPNRPTSFENAEFVAYFVRVQK